MRFANPIPVLRMFDEDRAREFYVDFLGFRVDWEHRFDPDTPLYLQLLRDACVLHLSGHHGDGTPGTALRIHVDDLDALQQDLLAKKYRHARPGILEQAWGRDMTIPDPFGNRITFTTAGATPAVAGKA
jgi:catechol 2,3-dioxygenase-like lactoylglutathione lyase family enzyme